MNPHDPAALPPVSARSLEPDAVGINIPKGLVTSVTLIDKLDHPDPATREAAWERFHRLYLPLLHAWARQFGHRSHDIDDLAQHVMTEFVQMVRGFKYDRDKSFRSLLKTILHREGLRLRRHPAKSLGDSANTLPAPAFDVDHEWHIEALRHAIAHVRMEYASHPKKNPLTFRAFELRVLEAKTGEETAAALGIRRDAVDKYKSRVAAEVGREVRRLAEAFG